jgi:peroxiredoxin
MLHRTGYALASIAMLLGFAATAGAQVDTNSLLKQPAPDFSLTTIDGRTVKLSDEKGKVVVLEFWRTAAADQIPTLLPFVQQLSDDKTLTQEGMVVWGMTAPAGQTKEQVVQYMKDKKYSFTVPFDADFKVFKKYLNHTLPATVIVGRDGTVIFADAGWDQAHVEHLKRLIFNSIDQGLNGYNGDENDLLGEPVPPIAITTFDGKKINLADLKGKVVLLDFWANWCPHCAKELPFIEKLASDPELARKGLVILTMAANIDEKEPEARAFYVKHGFTFPAAFDTDSKAGDPLGLEGVPSLFLIGRDGTLHNFFVGFDIASGPRAGGDISKDISRAVDAALNEPAGK